MRGHSKGPVAGAAIVYLFYNAESATLFKKEPKESEQHVHHNIDVILPLLREDEKKAVRILLEHNGTILQNELVLRLGFSKVRTTRIIASLERKQVVTKKRHGLTNSIEFTK